MTHSYKVHFFHLIWSTKYRKSLITPEVQSRLYPYMGGIIRNLNGSLLEIGGMADHVHLLVYLKNLDNYSEFIRDVKARSSLWVNKNLQTSEKFGWQQGLASLTVSYSLLEKTRNYIKNQEKHHMKMTFEEEYLKFLDGQNVTYDERFVLD